MNEAAYTTIARPAEAEFEEKKSRFIGSIAPVSSEAGAQEFISGIKSLNREARHNCYAFVLRDGTVRFSDDGEPQGTAGKPILEVVRREGLTDAALVVTRYFGGILLGAGGLTRAYAQAAKMAVDAAERSVMTPAAVVTLEADYGLYGKISYILSSYRARVRDTDFADGVRLTLLMPKEELEGFARELAEMSAGRVLPATAEECFAVFDGS